MSLYVCMDSTRAVRALRRPVGGGGLAVVVFIHPPIHWFHPSIHTDLTSTYPCCIITAAAQHTVGKTWEARKAGSGRVSARYVCTYIPTYIAMYPYRGQQRKAADNFEVTTIGPLYLPNHCPAASANTKCMNQRHLGIIVPTCRVFSYIIFYMYSTVHASLGHITWAGLGWTGPGWRSSSRNSSLTGQRATPNEFCCSFTAL